MRAVFSFLSLISALSSPNSSLKVVHMMTMETVTVSDAVNAPCSLAQSGTVVTRMRRATLCLCEMFAFDGGVMVRVSAY